MLGYICGAPRLLDYIYVWRPLLLDYTYGGGRRLLAYIREAPLLLDYIYEHHIGIYVLQHPLSLEGPNEQ